MNRKFRKTLAGLMAFLLCVMPLPADEMGVPVFDKDITASAEESDIETGSCGENATYILDNSTGVLTISGTGAVSDRFRRNTSIKTVVINDGITGIDGSAFAECINLASVSIPASVTSIGESAFYNCSSLTKFEMKGKAAVGLGILESCYALQEVTISAEVNESGKFLSYFSNYPTYAGSERPKFTQLKKVTLNIYSDTLPSYFFREWPHLTDITVNYCGNNDEFRINDHAFIECTALRRVTIPDKTTYLGNDAFNGCGALTSITIPESVTGIGSYAFAYCQNLAEVTIPNSVTSAGNNVFNCCTSLTRVEYPCSLENAGSWGAAENALAPQHTTFTNYKCDGCGAYSDECEKGQCGEYASYVLTPDGTLTISGTGGISRYAFENNNSIREVIIEDGIERIETGAFSGCRSLEKVTLPDTVTYIGTEAFADCRSLSSINIPDNVSTIRSGAFSDCSLTELTVPCGLNRSGLWGVDESIISVRHTGPVVDHLCSKCVQYDDGNERGSCGENAEYVLTPDGVLTVTGTGEINAWAFAGRDDIRTVYIGDGITSIGARAFNTCENLETINFSDSVETIGESAFGHCSSLKSVKLPSSLTDVLANTFDSCYALEAVTIPDGVQRIENSAFIDCEALNSVDLPNGLDHIGDSAFASCYELTSLTVPDTVTYIGSNAFTGSGLETLNVPCGLGDTWEWGVDESIVHVSHIEAFVNNKCLHCGSYDDGFETGDCGDDAYYVLSPDLELTISGTGEIWGSAFSERDDIRTVNIGDGITSIGVGAFADCGVLEAVSLPDSIETIGISAFESCYALTSLAVHDNVYFIGRNAFAGSGITDLSVPCGLENASDWGIFEEYIYVRHIGEIENHFCSHCGKYDDGYERGDCGNNAYYELSPEGELTVSGSGEIWPNAFRGKTDIRKVNIDNNINIIGSKAFFGCKNITDVCLADSIEMIAASAFEECDSLNSVSVPDAVYCIERNAFAESGITYLDVPCGLNNAWEWGVEEDNISVRHIGENIDHRCTNCGTYDEGCEGGDCGENAHYVLDSEYTLTISGTGEIWEGVFSGRNDISTVIIEDGITSIGSGAFNNCAGLKTVTIADSADTMGDYVFAECNNLQSVKLPSSLTAIGESTFVKCYSLETIIIPDGVKSIGSFAFFECQALNSITLPDGLESISFSVFEGCLSLDSLTVPDSVNNIEYGAFAESGITYLSVPCRFDGIFAEYDEYEYDNASYITSAQKWGIPEDYIIFRHEADEKGYCALCKKTSLDMINITAESLLYTGDYQGPVLDSDGGILIENKDYFVTSGDNNCCNANNYAMYITGMGKYYGSAEIVWSIERAVPTFTAPEAIDDLTYTGRAQQLIISGSTEDGKILYSLDGDSYHEYIPTAKDAGEYTVYYKVIGTHNYISTEAQSLTVTIGKAAPAVTAPAAIDDLIYTGRSQRLVSAGAAVGVTIQYSLDGKTYSTAVPTAKDAGTYTVYYKVTGDSNYSDAEAQSITVTIGKASPTVTAPAAIDDLIYTGRSQRLVSAGATTGGTMQYSLDGKTYSMAVPSAKDAGTYTVYYKVTGDSNYSDVASKSITVSISDGAEVISSISVGEDSITVTYANKGTAIATRTDTVAFDNVTVEMIDFMNARDIQLVIRYVNAFNASLTDNCSILTAAQMKASQYVLAYDMGR